MSAINEEAFNSVYERVSDNTVPMQKIVSEIVGTHCSCLDKYMEELDSMLCKQDDLPTAMLETVLLNINSMLYWLGNGLEQATLKESMAKMVREEVYNESYNSADGTIGDKKSVASLKSQQEELVRICYTQAVKLYQSKVDSAYEMVSAIKKILTRRIAEFEVSRIVT